MGFAVFGFLFLIYFFDIELVRIVGLICFSGGLATFICAMSVWSYRRSKREWKKGSEMTGEEAKEIFLKEFLKGSEMSREEAEILLREFFKEPDVKNKQKSYQERALEIVRDLLKKGCDRKDIQKVLNNVAKAYRKKPLNVNGILSKRQEKL